MPFAVLTTHSKLCRLARLRCVVAGLALGSLCARAEDGYNLWLRYNLLADEALRRSYAAAISEIVVPETPPGFGGFGGFGAGTINAARDELARGLRGLLGAEIPVVTKATRDGALLVGTPRSRPDVLAFVNEADLRAAGEEGYILRRVAVGDQHRVLLVANRDIGLLYGAFALLRHLQLHRPIDSLDIVSAPKIQRRMLDHWDNINGTIERGYAGRSLWHWDALPGTLDPRYRDYARACASIGINGVVPTNVNANVQFLTPDYLKKLAALAGAFRPYGIRLYLTVRFSSPVELHELTTADPLDPAVIKWWNDKADEIYRLIPDFGGFLVKANSEGQPGPQTYHRTHADGANLLADAVALHGGLVLWRAFVYDADVKEDRAKQAYDEFTPLDGRFRDNVVIQVKNGPIDFMPREPFHPLFGAMPKTPLALEVQITQEYTGGSGELCFLAPMWKEVLDDDTFRPARGATVARIVDGSAELQRVSVMAGVANTGSDRNWCGNVLAPANWYAFGRLAWDHTLTSAQIADEWTRLTFDDNARVVETLVPILLASREAVVNYSMPLGLHHIMARSHHQGPGPWDAGGNRADQRAVYFHRADANGIGFDRTATGSDALGQYAPEAAKPWADLATCPDEFLLWFHHVPWDYKLRSGRTLWDEICLHYQHGTDTVRGWQKSWATLAGAIDDERFKSVQALFARQEREARIWRDACTQYFATFSQRPLPAGVEPPAHPLDFYRRLRAPFTAADEKPGEPPAPAPSKS